jgi:hypothetical protein
MGYVVTLDELGAYVWGRATLIGTGNLIRTDAHVLFADTGELKAPGGKVYFQPMQHGAPSDRIEIDLSSIQRGGSVGPLEIDVKDDWAIARLREDAIEKFAGDRVFAFLWDVRASHDEIARHAYPMDSALVVSPEHTFPLYRSCQAVTDDDPSRYAFGVDDVFFLRCPPEHLQAGASGSALAIATAEETWHLGGQIVARGTSPIVRTAAGDVSERSGPLTQQVLLGNVPAFTEVLAIVYLRELIRRGLDPRNR